MVLRRVLFIARVRGDSMSPTLSDGDRLLVYRGGRRRTGRLVVFRARPFDDGGETIDISLMVKRLVATPGESVPSDLQSPAGPIAEPRVPPGRYLVRGDNPRSEDSRKFGYLHANELSGVVVRVLDRR